MFASQSYFVLFVVWCTGSSTRLRLCCFCTPIAHACIITLISSNCCFRQVRISVSDSRFTAVRNKNISKHVHGNELCICSGLCVSVEGYTVVFSPPHTEYLSTCSMIRFLFSTFPFDNFRAPRRRVTRRHLTD